MLGLAVLVSASHYSRGAYLRIDYSREIITLVEYIGLS